MDLLPDIECTLDFEELRPILEKKTPNYMLLPEPFKPCTETIYDYRMQLAIVAKPAANHFCVFKWYTASPHKMPKENSTKN